MPLHPRPRAKLPLCRYIILAGRESMFVSVMDEGSQRGWRAKGVGKGAVGGRFSAVAYNQ